MRKFAKFMCLAGLIPMLAACEDQYNYDYLITHPAVMRKKMDACATMSKLASNVEKQRCQIVMNASTKFMAIVAEQQTDAEKFGVRILATETAYADAKAKVKQLESDLAVAKAKPVDAAALHKMEEDLAAAKKDSKEKGLEVKTLLAVVGVSTPN